MKRRLSYLVLAVCAMALPMAGYAAMAKVGIKDLYAMALEQDPTWLAARKAWEADSQQQNIARAGLLPNIQLNYQNSPYNQQEWSGPQATSSGKTAQGSTSRHYNSHSGNLTLTQPVFDYGAWARYKAGVAQGQMADERLREQSMDLAVRLINHYLDIGLAQQKIEIAKSQQNTLHEHYQMNIRLLAAGEGTRTEALETEAQLRLAETEMLALQDELDAARRELAAIVGHPLNNLEHIKNRLSAKFIPQALVPASFEAWQTLTLKQSAGITLARHNVAASRRELQAQKGEFMPRVNLYASHNISKSATDTTIDQRYETTSVGLQVSMPLYSGGRSVASWKQASARLGQNQYELERIIRSTVNELHKSWRQCAAVHSRLNAYNMAVESAQLQLTATQKGVIAGQRVNLDVLNAEQQLYRTRMDLMTEKYNYIRSWLMLHYYAGKMNQEVIEKIDGYFN